MEIWYQFSPNLLIESIRYVKNYSVKKSKTFTWDQDNRCHSIECRDHLGKLFYKKIYEYDAFGNPILETIKGNCKEKGKNDTFTIRRQYSHDGRNLLLKEEREGGLTVSIQYLPQTNLVTCRLTKDGDRILFREFFEYDDALNLIRKIKDDGDGEGISNFSGVKQRTATTYVLRQQDPYLHKSEWIEETYLEQGLEKLLRKTRLSYDRFGNVFQRDLFDSNGLYAYTTYTEYNQRGDLIYETDPLGHATTYAYDDKGNLVSETQHAKNQRKDMQYDAAGRLTEEKVFYADETVHQTTYAYDLRGRCIQKIDPYGHATNYSYDPVTDQAITIETPSILTAEGGIAPVLTSAEWDSWGRGEISKTDANGGRKTFTYNAYGSPVVIVHPYGEKEIFAYTKAGKLSKYTDPDGNITEYTYDVLGRVRTKTHYSPQGALAASETFEYDAFHLVKQTDKEGNSTHYEYDEVGRKVREEFCGRVTELSYDSLGRLSKMTKHNGENLLVISYERDLMDRIIEETHSDRSGNLFYKISYTYDANGKISSITRYNEGKESRETFAYDSQGRLIEKRDPLGHAVKVIYNENHLNALGQKVLQTFTTSPENMTTIETKDPYGKIVKRDIVNQAGTILSSQEMNYDPNGNLVEQKDHLYVDSVHIKTQRLRYYYDLKNQADRYTRGYGTPEKATPFWFALLVERSQEN